MGDQQAFVDQIAAAPPPGSSRQPDEAARAVFAAFADQARVGEVDKTPSSGTFAGVLAAEFRADVGRSGA